MKTLPKKTKLLLSSAAGVTLALLIVLAINMLSSLFYFRLDLSRGKVYSVTPATKRILRALPDPVIITFWHSRELPPQVSVMRRYIDDILKEYVSASKGNVTFRTYLADDNQQSRTEAVKNGIIPVRFDTYSKEKYEAREGVFGMTLQFRDKHETIPLINDTSALEYELTSKITALTAQHKPVIGFVTSRGAASPYDFDNDLEDLLTARYDMQTVELDAKTAQKGIDPNIQALFLIGPHDKFSEQDIFILDQYLLSGRPLFAALDTRKINIRAFAGFNADTGLEGWLASKGLDLRQDTVYDAQNQPIQVAKQEGRYVTNNIAEYPPFVTATALSRENPVTRDMDSVIMPFAAPIFISTAAAGAKTDVLIKSSPISWTRAQGAEPFNMEPYQSFGIEHPKDKGPFNLAVVTDNAFRPFYTKPPKGVKAEHMLTAPAGRGRLMLVSTSHFLERSYQLPSANAFFFLNAADWLAQDPELISIRSKASPFHPLRETDAGTKAVFRYVNIFLPAVTAVLAGLCVWQFAIWRRKRHIKRFADKTDAR